MVDVSKKSIWYGRLETTSSNIPVIHDPGLPEPPTGQIYLYNAERDAILKYVADIVKPLLKNYEESERQQIEKTLRKKWKSARKAFLNEYGNRVTQSRKRKSTVAVPVQSNPELDIEIEKSDDEWSEDLDDLDAD
ncbi:MAG: hypothetical protein QNI91_14930 [Arenicellales bacterium]|nr:hypothetical protein [Arenicellales bacterium]